ncbi:MAG: class I SAM-dependent methyltransferase [Methanothermobacter sp.]
MQRYKNVKDHFEGEAKEYDELIVKLIPNYKEMITSLIASIPFENSQPLEVLDLGCGTGNITIAVKKRYPNARVTCLDLAEHMIETAKYKLSQYDDVKFFVGDFSNFQFQKGYDLIISSMALHHLKTDADKIAVYQKIYNALKEGGAFYNADNVLASNEYLENVNMEKWNAFMLENISEKEIEEKYISTYYEEDYPAPLIKHVDWLRDIGFRDVDVIWKYVMGAVFGGVK